MLNPKAHARARKRAIIAFARRLLAELSLPRREGGWRWQTGQPPAYSLLAPA